jgi:hypothetical protein
VGPKAARAALARGAPPCERLRVSAGGGVILSLLGVLGMPSTETPGDATPIRIELEAPPDCATAEAFFESVRARTERARPVKEGETGVRVVVKLTRVGQRAHGELRVIGDRGESDTRRVEGATCTEVVDALSLTVALAVDPTARLGPPPAKPEQAPAPVCPEPPPPEPPPPPPPRKLEVRVGAHADGLGQVSPFVSFGGDLSLRVIMPWASAPSFGLAVVRLQNDIFSSSHNASVRSTLFELMACPTRLAARDVFTFEPCALGYGGWLSATGRGVATTSEARRSYFALGGVLVGGAPLNEHWTIELRVGFALPVARRRFVVSNPLREVGETPSIAALGGVGITYSF